MGYNLINWENSPSKQTPINAENLNQMDENIAKAIQGARFNFSATFTADNVLKNTRQTDALGAGDFATSQTDITTAYVSNAVTKIGSGTFSNCTSLKTIYIDNTVGNVEIVSGAVPLGVSIVYSNDDNFINVNELLASAIKSLKKQVNADKSDWENRATNIEEQASSDKSELSQAIQGVKGSALEEFANVKADVSTNEKSIESLKADKLDKADFNTYKTATDKAIADNTKSIKANTTAIDKCVTDIANNSALIKKNSIKATTDKSTSIVLNDSSDCNIVDLKLHNTQANLYMCGKNFADFNTYFEKAEPWDRGTNKSKIVVTKDAVNKTITFNSVNDTDRSGINVFWKDSGIPFSYLTNKTITVSVDVSSTDDCKFFLCNACDNYKNISVNTTANKVSRVALTTKMPSDVSSIKDTSILLHVDSSKTTVTLSNFQIELSSTATDYENYKESQTITHDTDLSIVHTYYPSTTIISDSDFEVTYIADPKNYIDNKILEVATALVASESEVM